MGAGATENWAVNVDRYPTIGIKQTVASFEDALALVRSRYPRACAEGSMGAERTFVIGHEHELVAHMWPYRGRSGKFYLRIAPNREPT